MYFELFPWIPTGSRKYCRKFLCEVGNKVVFKLTRQRSVKHTVFPGITAFGSNSNRCVGFDQKLCLKRLFLKLAHILKMRCFFDKQTIGRSNLVKSMEWGIKMEVKTINSCNTLTLQ